MQGKRLKFILFFSASLLTATLPIPFISGWNEDSGFVSNLIGCKLQISLLGLSFSLPYRILLAVSVIFFYAAISDYLKPKPD